MITLLWIAGVVFHNYERIKNTSLRQQKFVLLEDHSVRPLSRVESDVGDVAGKSQAIDFPNAIVVYAPRSMTHEELNAWAPTFTQKYVQPRNAELTTQRWQHITDALLWAFLPPLALLALRVMIGWALSGFRQQP